MGEKGYVRKSNIPVGYWCRNESRRNAKIQSYRRTPPARAGVLLSYFEDHQRRRVMAGTRSRHGVAPLLSLSPMLTLLICPSVDAVVYQGSGNRCSAWYRGHCPNPNDLSVIGFHVSVGTLKDCMTYCYQAFVYGGPPCAFGVFLGTLQSENCLIINAGGQTTMEDYLDQCSNKRDSLLRKPASGQKRPRRVQKQSTQALASKARPGRYMRERPRPQKG